MKYEREVAEGYYGSNRERQMRMKKTRYWCYGCDGNLVSPGQKCEACGHRGKTKKRKGMQQ